LDQLLETEALLYRAARTGMDDFLKRDLAEAVDCAGGGGRHERCHALLRPMVLREDHCRAAQGMLCRSIRDKLLALPDIKSRFRIGGYSRFSSSEEQLMDAISRRMELTLASVDAYLHGEPQVAWQLVEPCTTADRLIVLGFTATMLHRIVSGRVVIDPCLKGEPHGHADVAGGE
jgi:hypothetical protein